jgi:hypothetical protein
MSFLFNFYLIRIVGGGVQTGSTLHVGHWMAYCTCPGWLWCWRIWWNGDWQGKPKYSDKTFPSATLSTTNPTWPYPGSNPGRRGGKPATNRLSYGAAISCLIHMRHISRSFCYILTVWHYSCPLCFTVTRMNKQRKVTIIPRSQFDISGGQINTARKF